MTDSRIQAMKYKFQEFCAVLSETEVMGNLTLIRALERLEKAICSETSVVGYALHEFERVLRLVSKVERKTNPRVKKKMGEIGALLATLRWSLRRQALRTSEAF